jgi:phosphate transport system permease protein
LLVTVAMNTLARLLLKRVGSNKPFWSFFRIPMLRPTATSGTVQSVSSEAQAMDDGHSPDTDSPNGSEANSRPRRTSVLPPATRSAALVDHVMTWVLWGCVAFTMSMLVVILAYMFYHGAGALNWKFFTELPPSFTQEAGGGLANAIVGTLQVVGWATAFAVPIGLLAAIYLSEYRPGRLAYTVRFIAEQLAGVPSILIGIFAAGLFGIISERLRKVGVNIRFYGWSGVFALAVLMVPIVMRAAEEALKLVPQSLRNAAFALGASHAQTIVKVTVPAALPAIITAIFLSIARIAGETAPLLVTAGTNSFWQESLNDFTPTLPPYIFKFAMSASDNWQRLAWAAAFLLMILVLGVNLGIRLITGKRVVSASRAD